MNKEEYLKYLQEMLAKGEIDGETYNAILDSLANQNEDEEDKE